MLERERERGNIRILRLGRVGLQIREAGRQRATHDTYPDHGMEGEWHHERGRRRKCHHRTRSRGTSMLLLRLLTSLVANEVLCVLDSGQLITLRRYPRKPVELPRESVTSSKAPYLRARFVGRRCGSATSSLAILVLNWSFHWRGGEKSRI